jgi:hypothetical protein
VTIGKELRDYLNKESVVPEGIDIYGLNSIRKRLELL